MFACIRSAAKTPRFSKVKIVPKLSRNYIFLKRDPAIKFIRKVLKKKKADSYKNEYKYRQEADGFGL